MILTKGNYEVKEVTISREELREAFADENSYYKFMHDIVETGYGKEFADFIYPQGIADCQ